MGSWSNQRLRLNMVNYYEFLCIINNMGLQFESLVKLQFAVKLSELGKLIKCKSLLQWKCLFWVN